MPSSQGTLTGYEQPKHAKKLFSGKATDFPSWRFLTKTKLRNQGYDLFLQQETEDIIHFVKTGDYEKKIAAIKDFPLGEGFEVPAQPRDHAPHSDTGTPKAQEARTTDGDDGDKARDKDGDSDQLQPMRPPLAYEDDQDGELTTNVAKLIMLTDEYRKADLKTRGTLLSNIDNATYVIASKSKFVCNLLLETLHFDATRFGVAH